MAERQLAALELQPPLIHVTSDRVQQGDPRHVIISTPSQPKSKIAGGFCGKSWIHGVLDTGY